MAQMNLSTEKKQTQVLVEQTYGCQGAVRGSGWTGNLGLVDANYCIWSGKAMRSCCTAQGTISSHLRWNEDNGRKSMCVCVCVYPPE